jgi:predicted transcriptional regulator
MFISLFQKTIGVIATQVIGTPILTQSERRSQSAGSRSRHLLQSLSASRPECAWRLWFAVPTRHCGGTMLTRMVRQFEIERPIDNPDYTGTIQTDGLSANLKPGQGDLVNIEPVTDGELSILEVIWEQGTPTTRDIAAAVYEKVSDSKMASVQKLLERLETKGCVSRDRRERAHRFGALVSREDFLRNRAARDDPSSIEEGTFQKEWRTTAPAHRRALAAR